MIRVELKKKENGVNRLQPTPCPKKVIELPLLAFRLKVKRLRLNLSINKSKLKG